jgi:hypothetical protein
MTEETKTRPLPHEEIDRVVVVQAVELNGP